MLKKALTYTAYLFFLAIVVLLLLEGCYRFYIIDFYEGNLSGLNEPASLKDSNKPSVLVIGDSFTASQKSYVDVLRKKNPDYRFINSAIPGTCIRQHAIIAPSRIRTFQPNLFLYQIYIGNDLLEFNHPLKSNSISFIRKVYWCLADHFLVLPYLNNKLSRFKPAFAKELTDESDPKFINGYHKDRYSSRSKLNFKADPSLIENSILLNERQEEDIVLFCDQIEKMITQLPENSKIALLVMPHCMQVNQKYIERMQEIGAQISKPQDVLQVDYPLMEYLKMRFSSQGIVIINPLSVLKENDALMPVYFENDPHLNDHGQGVIGEYLLEILKHEQLLETTK